MDLTHPAGAVVPSLDAEVLLVLAGTALPLTGRQVHRLAGRGSWTGVWKVLTRLERHGLVDVTQAGNANQYTLNRQHVAAPAALALVDLRGRLFERIAAAAAGWDVKPLAVSVFGSAARGDGGPESDIDLFVVRPARIHDDHPGWAEDLARLSASVRLWSGNAAAIVQASPAEVSAMTDRQEPIVESLRRDAVLLFGSDVLYPSGGAA